VKRVNGRPGYPGRCIGSGREAPVSRPASSPDLTPFDFFFGDFSRLWSMPVPSIPERICGSNQLFACEIKEYSLNFRTFASFFSTQSWIACPLTWTQFRARLKRKSTKRLLIDLLCLLIHNPLHSASMKGETVQVESRIMCAYSRELFYLF
jgi:hypothetical protein